MGNDTIDCLNQTLANTTECMPEVWEPNFTEGQIQIIVILSIISIVVCSAYVISYWVFHKDLSTKSSYEILHYVFIANIFNSAGTTVGFPSERNWQCWWEGLVTNIFTLAAVNWSMVLTLLLYSIVGFKKPLTVTKLHHLFSWGIPIIVSLIPLSTSTYGPPDGQVMNIYLQKEISLYRYVLKNNISYNNNLFPKKN